VGLAAAAGLLLAAFAASSARAATSVLETTFCLQRPAGGCKDPAGARSSVSLAQLPLDKNGRRAIYFFSRLRLETGRVAFLVIEREGSCYGKSQPKLFVSPRLRTPGWASFWEEVAKRLKDFSLSPRGQGLLAVGVAARMGPNVRQDTLQDIFFFGEREMNCPGKVLARVLDFDGNPLPGDNEIKELLVTP
jgi:hypothetical protein